MRLRWWKVRGRLWRYWRYLCWVLEGRLCRCGADFKGHKPRSVTWCVYNDAKE